MFFSWLCQLRPFVQKLCWSKLFPSVTADPSQFFPHYPFALLTHICFSTAVATQRGAGINSFKSFAVWFIDIVPGPSPCTLEFRSVMLWSKTRNSHSWHQIHETWAVDCSELPPAHEQIVLCSVPSLLLPKAKRLCT